MLLAVIPYRQAPARICGHIAWSGRTGYGSVHRDVYSVGSGAASKWPLVRALPAPPLRFRSQEAGQPDQARALAAESGATR